MTAAPAGRRIIPFPEMLFVFKEPPSINFSKDWGSFSGPSIMIEAGAGDSGAFFGACISTSTPYSKNPCPDFRPKRPESTNSFCSTEGAKRGWR